MFSDNDYMKFDSFLMSGLYYMNSIASEAEGIVIDNFKGNNAFDEVAFHLVENYSIVKSKPFYLKTNFFRFIFFKLTHKTKAKFYRKKYSKYLIVTPSNIIKEISKNENVGLNIVYDIYKAYYEERKVQ